MISRKPSGLSRPNLYLDLAHGWRVGGSRRFEVQFQCLTQILESFFFSSTLAGNIDIQTLGNEPFPFAPNSSRKRTLHETILAQLAQAGFKWCSRAVVFETRYCGGKAAVIETDDQMLLAQQCIANLRKILLEAHKVHSRQDYTRLAEPILLDIRQREQGILDFFSRELERPVAS